MKSNVIEQIFITASSIKQIELFFLTSSFGYLVQTSGLVWWVSSVGKDGQVVCNVQLKPGLSTVQVVEG